MICSMEYDRYLDLLYGRNFCVVVFVEVFSIMNYDLKLTSKVG